MTDQSIENEQAGQHYEEGLNIGEQGGKQRQGHSRGVQGPAGAHLEIDEAANPSRSGAKRKDVPKQGLGTAVTNPDFEGKAHEGGPNDVFGASRPYATYTAQDKPVVGNHADCDRAEGGHRISHIQDTPMSDSGDDTDTGSHGGGLRALAGGIMSIVGSKNKRGKPSELDNQPTDSVRDMSSSRQRDKLRQDNEIHQLKMQLRQEQNKSRAPEDKKTARTKNEELLKEEIAKLKSVNADLAHAKELALRQAKRREMELENHIEKLERESEEQDKKVQLAHSAAKVIMEESRTFASSDDDVRSWFSGRSQDWYDWAWAFGHGQPARIDMLEAAQSSELYAALSRFVILDNGRLPTELAGKRRTVYTLLHAMLGHFICDEVLASPFWTLDAVDDAKFEALPGFQQSGDGRNMAPMPGSESMRTLFALLTKLQPREGHQCRSLMAHIMAVNGMGEGRKGVSDDQLPLVLQRREYASQLTRRFLNGPAKHLLKDEELLKQTNYGDQLCGEIDKALQYSIGLWSHRSSLQCLDLASLHEQRFSSRMQTAELYQADKVKHPVEGQPIMMVVQPAVIAWGTEDGHKYESTQRTWMKAQVCVRAPEPEVPRGLHRGRDTVDYFERSDRMDFH